MGWMKQEPLLWSGTGIEAIRVSQKGSIRYLRFASDGMQGAWDIQRQHWPVFPYQRAFMLYQNYRSDIKSFLSLGVGAGTAMRTVRQFHPDAHLIGVDRDPLVIDTAKKWFQSPQDEKSTYIAADAGEYLYTLDQKFDLIFLDVFDSFRTPSHLLNQHAWRLLQLALTEQGMIAVNLIDVPRSPFSNRFQRLVQQISDHFSWVDWVPTRVFPFTEQNILVFAGCGPRPDHREWKPQGLSLLEHLEMKRWQHKIRILHSDF